MAYKFLAEELWPLADEVVAFYGGTWGVAPTKVRKEEPLLPDLGFVPTLHAQSHDHHWICVEVATSPYTSSLDSFVLACRNRGLPVRLYVAVPETSSAASFQAELRRARAHGVGVLETTASGIEVVSDALSLSLTDVRAPDLTAFPPKLRAQVSGAHQTFRSGDPSKGCLRVYEEIEALTKKAAERALKVKAWKNLPKGAVEPKLSDVSKAPWAAVARTLVNHVDGKKLDRPGLNEALFARILGITPHRNETGHKLKDAAALQRRDRQMRTRFENACDLLEELNRALNSKR